MIPTIDPRISGHHVGHGAGLGRDQAAGAVQPSRTGTFYLPFPMTSPGAPREVPGRTRPLQAGVGVIDIATRSAISCINSSSLINLPLFFLATSVTTPSSRSAL